MPAELLTVKSALPPTADGGEPVALWEVHPDHPIDPNSRRGEVVVHGDRPVRVARTAAVQDRLRSGALVEVKSGKVAEVPLLGTGSAEPPPAPRTAPVGPPESAPESQPPAPAPPAPPAPEADRRRE